MGLEDVGYAKRGAIDWAGMAKTVSSKVDEIGAAREKAKAENEAVFQETNSLLNKPLNLEKQSLTQFVLQSSDEYKKMALDLKKKLYNREITSSEYKQILANSQEYWQNFADQAKSADDRFKLYQERSTPDANGVIAASNAEDFLMEQYLNAADLNNKKMVIGKDGSMYLQAVDPNTGQAVGAPIDYRDFARPENMQINRVDVGEAVKNITANWKSFQQWKDLGRGGEQTIESIKLQPGYKESKIQAVNAVVNNPKAALSVLVDNALPGGGIYYTSDADGKRMVDEAIATAKAQKQSTGAEWTKADEDAIRLSAVKFSKNAAGEWMPELTEEQMVKAKEAVDREIDMQMEYTIGGSAKQQWASLYGGGGGADNKKRQLAEGWKLTVNAMTAAPVGATSENNDYLAQLSAKTGRYFERKKFSDGTYGIVVYNMLKDSKGGSPQKDENSAKEIRTAKALSQYVFGGDLDQANSEWEQGKIHASEFGIEAAKPKSKSNNNDPLGLGL